ncbi:MAG: hypothetical protein ACI87E_000671 [Mariniblastus sp.]
MFRPKPFKNAEVNPEPPQRDSRDYIELVFSFLWFYHKTFVALALLIGLGFWIAYVIKKPRTGLEDVPKAQLVLPNLEITPDKTSPTTLDSEPLLDSKTTEPGPPQKGSVAWLLKEGSVDELIQKSLELAESWGLASPGVGLKLCADRVSIARQLLNMNLTESERQYAIISYVDAVSLVDTLNVVSRMGVEGTREALKEIGEKYSNHPDELVRAKTHLAITLAALYDFKQFKTAPYLETYEAALVANFDSIALDGPSLERLTDLALIAQLDSTDEVKATQATNFLIDRLTNLKTPQSKNLAERITQTIAFQAFDLAVLLNLAQAGSPEANAKIDQFFGILAEHPNSTLKVYEIAINCILQYQRAGNFERVVKKLVALEAIAETIDDQEKQKKVQDILDRIKIEYGL